MIAAPPTHKLGPLEIRALELLREAAPSTSRFIRCPRAIGALAKLRIDRRLALLLIAYLHRRGLLVATCGHGITLIPEAEARERGDQRGGHQGSGEVIG